MFSGNSATSSGSARRSPRRSGGVVHAPTSPESTSTTGGVGPLEADLLGLDNLALDHRSASGSSVHGQHGPVSGGVRSRPPSAPTSLSNPAAGGAAADKGGSHLSNSVRGTVGVAGQAGSASPRYVPTDAEHVVITAGASLTLSGFSFHEARVCHTYIQSVFPPTSGSSSCTSTISEGKQASSCYQCTMQLSPVIHEQLLREGALSPSPGDSRVLSENNTLNTNLLCPWLQVPMAA